MQNDHTQPPNITRKIRICYVQLAKIETFQKVAVRKIYQQLTSDEDRHPMDSLSIGVKIRYLLSITNCNRACLA